MDDINKHPDLPWDWLWTSRNPNLTMDFILEHLDELWDWVCISWNLGVTMDTFDPLLDYNEYEWIILSRSIFQIQMKQDYENICSVFDTNVNRCELMFKTELCEMLGVDKSFINLRK